MRAGREGTHSAMVTPAGNGGGARPLLEQTSPNGAARPHWDSSVLLGQPGPTGTAGPTELGTGRAGTGQWSTQALTAILVVLPYSSPK